MKDGLEKLFCSGQLKMADQLIRMSSENEGVRSEGGTRLTEDKKTEERWRTF